MDLKPGDKLGPYEILSLIGVGGMGEVYKARDPRLDRIVALKVSKGEFTDRFKQEARLVAQLNHRNICTLYDVGPNYLVMEFIDGVALKGPLPVEKAVEYAGQILDALDHAHRKGITHRDLKPGNVMVTKEGIKLLDFGLAKQQQSKTLGPDDPTAPSVTKEGQISGTLQYMAPEQLESKDADARSDIFAFGCVLYEMLSGAKAFGGASPASIIAAIMEREPEPLKTTPPLDRVIRTCLAKDPDQRFQTAVDLKRNLLWAMEGESVSSAPSQSRFGKTSWALAAISTLALAALAFVHFREMPPASPALNLSVALPANSTPGFVALSPDGRRLVISLGGNGKTQLALRSLDSPGFQFLPGTDSARAPFWSPDGETIAFFADGKLKTIPASGGPPQVLCDGAGGGGGTWNRDGVILFNTSTGLGVPLQRVDASGGVCAALAKPEDDSNNLDPEFLPDGKHFVYVNDGRDEAKRGLYVASLDNPTHRRLLADVSSAVFAPSLIGKKYGYLLFLRGSALMAQPFNAETLQLAGDVFPIAAEASFSLNAPAVSASVSASGILACANISPYTNMQLTWLDRSGKELGRVGSIQFQQHVILSPDGRTVATLRNNQGIWLYDAQSGADTRFISPASKPGAAVWSPDGKLIAFGTGNGHGLYVKDASGGLNETLLFENQNQKSVSDWSRDGRYLIYTENDPKNRGDIWFLPDPLGKSNERKPVRFQATEADESQGQISPDGRWLAYTSNESGRYEVYVRPFPSGPGRWKVSNGAGIRGSWEPRWGRDGKELFYLGRYPPTNRLMTVAVQAGASGDFQAGAPKALLEFRGIGVVQDANQFLYSPGADGKRFLVNEIAGDAQPTLNVISNWETAARGN